MLNFSKCMALVMGSSLFSGCGVSRDAYQATHLSAKIAVPIAVEMETLFGSADHFITHFGFPGEEVNDWNTVVYFGGRYVLTMQVDVKVDYKNQAITQVGEPIFYLMDVKDIRLEKYEGEEIPSVTAFPGFQTQFTKDEWRAVFNTGGDFSAIGINLNPEPVKHFTEYEEAWRRPIIPVTLLGKRKSKGRTPH